MENRVGLNLLYAQTVSDIEHGWILVTKEQHRQLKSLQEKVSKKEVSCFCLVSLQGLLALSYFPAL